MMTFIYIIIGLVVLVLILAIVIKPKNEELKSFPWADELDPVCITVDEIANGTVNALVVYHNYGRHGSWQFYDGKDIGERKPKVIEKAEILKIDDTLLEVVDLDSGWKAKENLKGTNG